MLQIIIIVVLLAADQVTKFTLWASLPVNGTVPVIPGVLNFTQISNEGASFGMFQGAQVFFIILTFFVLIAALFYMIRFRHKQSRYFKIVIAMLFAGALGNLIDRIAFGYVRDFIDIRLFDFWKYVFNIADASLVIGAILLAVYLLFFYKDKKTLVQADTKCGDTEKGKNDDDSNETSV